MNILLSKGHGMIFSREIYNGIVVVHIECCDLPRGAIHYIYNAEQWFFGELDLDPNQDDSLNESSLGSDVYYYRLAMSILGS